PVCCGPAVGVAVPSETNETAPAARGDVASDVLHERLAAELLADPRMERLLAEALALTGDDPDEAATLVRWRLRQGHPADQGARRVLGRAVALAVHDAATRSRQR